MKKFLLLIICLIVFIPVMVNAESGYLYDVLKNEAESNGLAREYTGEHHDSFTEEPSKKIYHWYAENETQGTQVLDKNNVIFADYCWQIVRTTDTGGVKMIYNGVPSNGRCISTGTDTQIGKSSFNNNYSSLSDVGYMFNNRYESKSKEISYSEIVYTYVSNLYNSYWFADSVSWDSSTNKWKLDNPYQVSSIMSNAELKQKYTFLSSDKDYSNEKVYLISYINSSRAYLIIMENGHDISYYNYTYTYGNDYTDNGDGTYSINSPRTFTRINYHINPSSIKNKYVCIAEANNTCDDIWYVNSSFTTYFSYRKLSDNYKFTSGVRYDSGINKYYLVGDPLSIFNCSDDLLFPNINNNHYTFFNNNSESNKVSFTHYISDGKAYYIELEDGKDINDAYREMLRDDNINVNNSTIKNMIDNWYHNNLVDYTSYIEDTIYCNDRSVKELNGWATASENIYDTLEFGQYELGCQNETDKFSINNNKAKLTYPVGLLTVKEATLVNYAPELDFDKNYWLLSPSEFDYSAFGISFGGSYYSYRNVNKSLGVRPSISLKTNTRYLSGNGSTSEPYLIDLTDYYSIDVIINNETEDISIEIDDLTKVPEGEEVDFKVTPIKGYKVNNIKILDSNNHEINYTTMDNKNYHFIMPASNVTIIPSYERVSNSVSVEDNINTKEFVIEVNDATAVVYEDKVKFIIVPEDGYKIEKVIIKDKNNKNISYRKTSNKNEYEFIMPDTDVTITPVYRKIESNNIINPKTVGPLITIVILSILVIVSVLIRKKIRLNKDYL